MFALMKWMSTMVASHVKCVYRSDECDDVCYITPLCVCNSVTHAKCVRRRFVLMFRSAKSVALVAAVGWVFKFFSKKRLAGHTQGGDRAEQTRVKNHEREKKTSPYTPC
jgi:hypothetical protein